jgi:hypothetical protein
MLFAQVCLLAITEKRIFFERQPRRLCRGMVGNGSIQRLWRPQIAHWRTVGGCEGAAEVIGATP